MEVKVNYQSGEPVAANFWDDHEWFHTNYDSLLEQYGEGVVLVFEKQVVGVGETISAAVANALETHASDFGERVITPVIEVLSHQTWFPRIAYSRVKRHEANDSH